MFDCWSNLITSTCCVITSPSGKGCVALTTPTDPREEHRTLLNCARSCQLRWMSIGFLMAYSNATGTVTIFPLDIKLISSWVVEFSAPSKLPTSSNWSSRWPGAGKLQCVASSASKLVCSILLVVSCILQGWSHGPQMGHRYPGPDDHRYPVLYLEWDIYLWCFLDFIGCVWCFFFFSGLSILQLLSPLPTLWRIRGKPTCTSPGRFGWWAKATASTLQCKMMWC